MASSSAARQGFCMWMPNMPMILLSVRDATRNAPARATFRMRPEMTKHKVKEYLTKIYGVEVDKVATQNVLRKRTRLVGACAVGHRKEPDWKKAIVSFPRRVERLGVATRVDAANATAEREE